MISLAQTEIFEVSDEDINIGISVQKGNTELLDALNSVLDKMTEDDYKEMMDKANFRTAAVRVRRTVISLHWSLFEKSFLHFVRFTLQDIS